MFMENLCLNRCKYSMAASAHLLLCPGVAEGLLVNVSVPNPGQAALAVDTGA